MTNHPDPGFGGVCPRPEGGAYCTICGLCLDHCQCKRASKTTPTDHLNEGGRVGVSGSEAMSGPTKGLRVEFEPGICGLKFVAGEGKYPESNGPTDVAYINRLIEADAPQQRDRCPDGKHDWGEYFCRRCGSSVVQLG